MPQVKKIVGFFCGTGLKYVKSVKEVTSPNHDRSFAELTEKIQDQHTDVYGYDGCDSYALGRIGAWASFGIEAPANDLFKKLKVAEKEVNLNDKIQLNLVGHSRGCLSIFYLALKIWNDPTLRHKVDIVIDGRDPVPGNPTLLAKMDVFELLCVVHKFKDLSKCKNIKSVDLTIFEKGLGIIGFATLIPKFYPRTKVHVEYLPGLHDQQEYLPDQVATVLARIETQMNISEISAQIASTSLTELLDNCEKRQTILAMLSKSIENENDFLADKAEKLQELIEDTRLLIRSSVEHIQGSHMYPPVQSKSALLAEVQKQAKMLNQIKPRLFTINVTHDILQMIDSIENATRYVGNAAEIRALSKKISIWKSDLETLDNISAEQKELDELIRKNMQNIAAAAINADRTEEFFKYFARLTDQVSNKLDTLLSNRSDQIRAEKVIARGRTMLQEYANNLGVQLYKHGIAKSLAILLSNPNAVTRNKEDVENSSAIKELVSQQINAYEQISTHVSKKTIKKQTHGTGYFVNNVDAAEGTEPKYLNQRHAFLTGEENAAADKCCMNYKGDRADILHGFTNERLTHLTANIRLIMNSDHLAVLTSSLQINYMNQIIDIIKSGSFAMHTLLDLLVKAHKSNAISLKAMLSIVARVEIELTQSEKLPMNDFAKFIATYDQKKGFWRQITGDTQFISDAKELQQLAAGRGKAEVKNCGIYQSQFELLLKLRDARTSLFRTGSEKKNNLGLFHRMLNDEKPQPKAKHSNTEIFISTLGTAFKNKINSRK